MAVAYGSKVTIINKRLISSLIPQKKPYEVRDKHLKGFIVRVNVSGKKNYICEYTRGKRVYIGSVNVLTPAQARDEAKIILANVAKGIYPSKSNNSSDNKKNITLKKFIEEKYAIWKKQTSKSGKEMIRAIRSSFFEKFGDCELDKIKNIDIEDWRTKKIASGLKPATTNRAIAYLRSALSQAMAWELLIVHPLKEIKLLKENNDRVRYLSNTEEKNLREALIKREIPLKQSRENFNKWRKDRNYELYPQLGKNDFADHLQPMTLLALNTGMRRGEIFSLTWDKVDFLIKNLTIIAANAKSNKIRHIPLNSEAFDVLKQCHKQSSKSGLVFPNKYGKCFNNIDKSWRRLLKKTMIEDFHFHDLRHDFASKLVMAGVDLNTVRELLGHSDIKMTLRYAHLAPEHKASAVAKLVTARNANTRS
ncbi:MAG: recombinase [Thiotrichales bacterium]|nr:MAG: recombinase [Thiotrichales bacterium]